MKLGLEFTEDKEKNILDISMKNYDSNILLINLADPLEEAPLIMIYLMLVFWLRLSLR